VGFTPSVLVIYLTVKEYTKGGSRLSFLVGLARIFARVPYDRRPHYLRMLSCRESKEDKENRNIVEKVTAMK
jgi:hypothetical protein